MSGASGFDSPRTEGREGRGEAATRGRGRTDVGGACRNAREEGRNRRLAGRLSWASHFCAVETRQPGQGLSGFVASGNMQAKKMFFFNFLYLFKKKHGLYMAVAVSFGKTTSSISKSHDFGNIWRTLLTPPGLP